MKYQLAPIYVRPWTVNGMSTKLIESHYENNYGGALRRLNALTEQIEQLDFSKTQDIIEGATWYDPDRVDEWIGTLRKDEPVVTFCVYGFHVGCRSAIALRDAGFDAMYMKGGHSAWKAIGGKTKMFG